MSSPEDRWLDQAAGPVVRPYTLTRGRTRPRGEPIDLIAVIEATDARVHVRLRLSPEHRRLLVLCRQPVALADLASEMDLPVDVVRVLLDDLRDERLVRVLEPTPSGLRPDEFVLRKLLHGLRAF
ncbi:DUF742 domain-containing protein [Actinoallomurus sp. NPDC050550]|uniref:DUF742 domain-containing protein n=1 Tax=Actinoallomurus sp. NPDC050550 TaxID=3154937 RepID=UPI0033C08E1F